MKIKKYEFITQEEFERTIEEFSNIEDARDQLWDRAKKLIETGFEIEAHILILATWNFARFRYFIKNFDLESFERVIKETRPIFKKLEDKTFENVNFMDHVLKSDIKDLFTSFKNIVEQTGASKLMALKNQNLFIMWDTEIRRMHGIDNRGGADDYMKFLVKMHFLLAPLEIGHQG